MIDGSLLLHLIAEQPDLTLDEGLCVQRTSQASAGLVPDLNFASYRTATAGVTP